LEKVASASLNLYDLMAFEEGLFATVSFPSIKKHVRNAINRLILPAFKLLNCLDTPKTLKKLGCSFELVCNENKIISTYIYEYMYAYICMYICRYVYTDVYIYDTCRYIYIYIELICNENKILFVYICIPDLSLIFTESLEYLVELCVVNCPLNICSPPHSPVTWAFLLTVSIRPVRFSIYFVS
jgi:hypothetical protein